MNNIIFKAKLFFALPTCYFCRNGAELHFTGGNRSMPLCLDCASKLQKEMATAIEQGFNFDKAIESDRLTI